MVGDIIADSRATSPGIRTLGNLLLPRDVVERARQMTDGPGLDTGFDTIGSEKTALQVIDAVAPGGRAVRVGIPAFATRRR